METNLGKFFRSGRGKIVLCAGLVSIVVFLFFLYVIKQGDIISEKILSQNYEGVLATVDWLRKVSAIFFVSILLVMVIVGAWLFMHFKKSIDIPLAVLSRMAKGDIKEEQVTDEDDASALITAANQVARNQQSASDFTKHIGEGQFDEDFQPVSDQDVLGNSLVQMRDKLKAIAEEDSRRNWITKGLALFGDLLRRNSDYGSLTGSIITELVKYTRANQGGLFVLNTDQDSDHHLQLVACYAYERKKFIDKRIDIGQGLVGQCFLERHTVFLKEVPPGYLSITSGLGEASPKCLLIVPMIVNNEVEGVVELASFQEFEQHEIEFVEKIGEQVASVLAAVKINERTKQLLEQSQQQSEEMRAQEEEMRQNMEELQATQEHLQRQTDEMRKIQESLELEKSMFHILLDFLPDRITYKDTQSRITRINKAKAQRLNMRPEEVIGKTDYDFFPPEHAEKAMREEQELIRSGKPLLDIEERTILKGDMVWSSTSRIPFKNDRNQVTGMFIITRDIKELRLAEMALKDQQKLMNALLENFPLIQYKINDEGILFEVRKGNVNGMFSKLELEGLHVSQFSEKLLHAYKNKKEELISEVIEHNGTKALCRHYIFPNSAFQEIAVGMTLVSEL